MAIGTEFQGSPNSHNHPRENKGDGLVTSKFTKLQGDREALA